MKTTKRCASLWVREQGLVVRIERSLQPDGGFILDDWSVNTSPFQKNDMDHEYPWEEVEVSRRNRRLQKRHPLPEGIQTDFSNAKPCPKCGASPDALTWFYFRSPKETWADGVWRCRLDGGLRRVSHSG
jgi:hypothetical protein